MFNNIKRNHFKTPVSSVIVKRRVLKKQINEFISNVPSNLSELELIRYIYLNLGKILVYNTNYYYNSNSKEKQAIFENNKHIIFPRTNEIICNSTELFTYLLKKFNIDAETFYSALETHAETVVFTSDKKMYSFNLVGDLSRIQTNRKTTYFATDSYFDVFIEEIESFYHHPCSSMSASQLKAIDDKLGYTFRGIYTDDFISMLKKDIAENSAYIIPPNTHFKDEYDKKENMRKYLVEFLLNRCNILNEELSPVGFEETTHYYWNLFMKVLSKEDLSKVNLYRCFFDKKISNKDMISIISLSCKDSYIYYLYNRKLRKIYKSSQRLCGNLIKIRFENQRQ